MKCKDKIKKLIKLQKEYMVSETLFLDPINEYIRGVYNGLELSLSIFEDRLPEYKCTPLKEEQGG